MLDASSGHKHSAASEELTRMAVTLLLDALAADDASGLSQVDACSVYTLACLGVTYGLQDCRSALHGKKPFCMSLYLQFVLAVLVALRLASLHSSSLSIEAHLKLGPLTPLRPAAYAQVLNVLAKRIRWMCTCSLISPPLRSRPACWSRQVYKYKTVFRWAYEQVAEALCKLYKTPEGRVGQHLLYGSPRAGCPGALADALLALAQGLVLAHTDIR